MNATTRRSFLTAAAAGTGAVLLGGDRLVRAGTGVRTLPAARSGTFAQGVASGEQATDAITLWTRLDEVDRSLRLQVEVSPDPDFRRLIWRQDVVADSEADFTVHHRVGAGAGLRPGEQYFYRFATCERSSEVGRFRTALPADSREPVRIGFFSCQKYTEGFYNAHAGLAAEDLDLVVCLGDYIYERGGTGSMPDRRDMTGVNRDSEAQLLPEYRDKYRLYHSDAELRAVRAAFPVQAIWDDHETENDNAGAQPSPDPAASNVEGRRRVPYLDRRANGYRAFFEQMPRLRVPGDPDRIYGTVGLGANVDLLLLDERQYRDQQPCGGMNGTERPCPPSEREDPSRTLLGAGQKAWLKDELVRSRKSWKVIGNQVMIMALEAPTRNALNPDQWDGYAAERREILEHAQGNGVQDIAFVTGDIHVFFAGNVTPSGREGVAPVDGTPAAVEFVAGSITSEGLSDDLPRSVIADVSTDAGVRSNNPHIVFAELARKGYAVVEATPDELRCTFRAVETVATPGSPAFDLARFRVGRGSARVERTDAPIG